MPRRYGCRRQHVEVNGALVVVEEEGVVEGLRLPGLAPVRVPADGAVEDEVGEDRLFLLPPGLAVVPGEAVRLLVAGPGPLDHVVPAAALHVAADGRHDVADPARQFLVRRLGLQRVHPHQVPGDLEVVTDDGAVLLPAVLRVGRPVAMEALLDERAVLVVREAVRDGVEGVLQEVGVLLLAGRQVQVDQVGGRVVADRVPVLALRVLPSDSWSALKRIGSMCE